MPRFLLSLLCGSAVVLTGGAAFAQSQLEEVVVTARKRAESLQDVPVSVSAISKSELENNVALDLNKIGELAPQVMIGRAVGGTGAIITIRGISSATVDGGLDQSVSLSVDGVSLSRGRLVQAAMFDMQQVEILQGPQALFFGKNSPAGVISITSADPTGVFEGRIKGGYEFTADERYAEGYVSGPLTDTLKARIALRYSKMDGWMRNAAVAQANPFQPFAPLPGALQGKTTPKGRNIAGRFTLQWDPREDFTAKFKLMMNSERFNDATPFNEEFCTNGQTIPTILGRPAVNGSDCKADRVIARTAVPAVLAAGFPYGNGGVPFSRSDMSLGSLNLEKTFGPITVAATTGYYDQTQKGFYNADRSEYAQIFAADTERYRLMNQELRVNTDFAGPINVMVGAYYEHADRTWLNAPSILNVLDPVSRTYATMITHSHADTDSVSVFGQLRWKIAPTLELAGGARYSRDWKQAGEMNILNNLATATGRTSYPQGVTLYTNYSGKNVSPEVTLTWKPDADQMAYAAYKTGYKAGGISNPAILPAGATTTSLLFGPEKVKGFEAGYKAELFANRVRVDATVYRYNYNGLQVTAYDSARVAYSLANAAKARTTGVMGSVLWLATDNLTLSGNAGYNRARYLSFPNAQCRAGQTVATGCVGGVQDLSGKTLTRAPKVTFKLGADYKADIAQGWTADLSVSAAYSASYQTNTEYADGGQQPSYWLLNAAVHLNAPEDRYRLSLVGRNLTNTYYKVTTNNQSLGTPNQYSAAFNRPREVLLELAYNF